jgi:hypothetical protein
MCFERGAFCNVRAMPSIRVNGSDWSVVRFENAAGTYLLKGEDVYLTQLSLAEAETAITRDAITLPGIGHLAPAGDIEIEIPDISFSNLLETMEPSNRARLEAALSRGASVGSFWTGAEPSPLLIVSFENNPNTYIFDNAGRTAQRTGLDFGATRFAIDTGQQIRDLAPIHEIEGPETMIWERASA